MSIVRKFLEKSAGSPKAVVASREVPLQQALSVEGIAPSVHSQLNAATKLGEKLATKDAEQEFEHALASMNAAHFVAPEGGKVSVWKEGQDYELNRQILIPMSPTDFKALHQNPTFAIKNEATGNTSRVSLGTAWLRWSGRREYIDGMALLPEQEAPEGVYNLWRSWGVPAVAGDVEAALWHIKHVICNGDGSLTWYLVRWMAWCVQNPAKQAEVAIVLQGRKGTGKGTLGRWLLEIFGMHGLRWVGGGWSHTPFA